MPTPTPVPTPVPTSSPAPVPAGVRFLAGGGTIGSASSLAFSSLSLYSVRNGQTVTMIANGAKNPDVNSQHSKVVFERYPGYTWLMNPDGSGLRPLSPTSGGGWMEPRFAPDGHTVVMAHDTGGGHNEIFSIDTDSGATVQLTNTGTRYPWKWRPSLDPTGTRLILTYGTDSNQTSGPNSHIGVASLGAGLITDFTPLTAVDPIRPSYDGAFSPNGSQIIFDAGGQIWVANATGAGAHPVVAGRLGRFDPVVSGQILFTHDVGTINTHTQLWAAGVDGSNPHMVADGNFSESFCDLP